MPFTATNTIANMRASVFFEAPDTRQKHTRFWTLLVLAAIIASAGVVADSTATVIGAMIVAPLMTPILGIMLAIVLADRPNLIRSLLLVAAGALAAIAIGWLIGLLSTNPIIADTNSQVAGRVSPRLIDLLAALATGIVGSVALVRSDIADALPGVAIAISLVPPLTVVGLTLESGEPDQSLGALLLFATNVAAILASGIIVMLLYGMHRMADATTEPARQSVNRRRAYVALVITIALIVIPLTASSVRIAQDTRREINARNAAEAYGTTVGWDVVDVTTQGGVVNISMEGLLPVPDPELLRTELAQHSVDPADVRVEFHPVEIVNFD